MFQVTKHTNFVRISLREMKYNCHDFSLSRSILRIISEIDKEILFTQYENT